ncbi:MAG: hypothetical protein WA047_13440 [Phenylobacterium sp.]|uniref:hypothetical protein n=1 Tax=Phenylobacterium sp. TaxID=1871053 RepID=UPI003BB806D4
MAGIDLVSLGQVAGIAGVAFGAVVIIFGGIIRQKLPLPPRESFILLTIMVVCVWTLGIGALALSWHQKDVDSARHASPVADKKKDDVAVPPVVPLKKPESPPASRGVATPARPTPTPAASAQPKPALGPPPSIAAEFNSGGMPFDLSQPCKVSRVGELALTVKSGVAPVVVLKVSSGSKQITLAPGVRKLEVAMTTRGGSSAKLWAVVKNRSGGSDQVLVAEHKAIQGCEKSEFSYVMEVDTLIEEG